MDGYQTLSSDFQIGQQEKEASQSLGRQQSVVPDIPCTCFLMVFFLQILMSVRLVVTTVMRRHSALTQRGVSPALATLATLEMAQNVVWCSQSDFY